MQTFERAKAAKTTIGTLRRIKQRARANFLGADLLELLALAKTSTSNDIENSNNSSKNVNVMIQRTHEIN